MAAAANESGSRRSFNERMKSLCWIFLFLVCGLGARAELPLIADAARDPAWRELFAQLAPTRSRQSTFEERRYFAFRKDPVVLTGEIRIDPGHGLSLRYRTPETRVLIADEKGLLMRDGEGRKRVPPSDDRSQGAMTALVNVLHFDLPALEKSFAVHGRREGETWALAFVPRDPQLAASFGTLTLSGEQSRLRKIEIVRTTTQRIEIVIGETQDGVIFTGEALRLFFR